MRLRDGVDGQRQGGLDSSIDGQVDLVLAVFFEFEVLYIQDQIDRDGGGVVADADGDLAFEFGADGVAISVDNENTDGVVAGFDL